MLIKRFVLICTINCLAADHNHAKHRQIETRHRYNSTSLYKIIFKLIAGNYHASLLNCGL